MPLHFKGLIVRCADCATEFQQLLCQDDQLILIKSGFFEVWMTRMARMFDTSHMTLLFTDGGIVPRTELEVIFSVCSRRCLV